ncbi:MAG: glycosyltransferase family 39 protein [Candidatus Omnitrophota bacterium]|nr:glycosyltransferase family 39 protein [Candidatus Omnitrophota bacterium]
MLRFYNLAQKGLWHSDEIDYYLVCHDAIKLFKSSVFCSSGMWQKIDGLYKTLQMLVQYPPKFAFYLVNSISWAFVDKHSTILFVNAVASILTIVTIFFVGRKFFNLRVGIIASTLFSFSLIYLRYSRNGFSMALTYLFLVLSIYYYLDFLNNLRIKNLAISGFILGIGLLFHAQIFLFTLVIIFAEFLSFLYFYHKNISEFIRRITVFIPAFFLPLALLEITTNVGRIFHCYSARGYFRQIFNTTTGNLVSQQGMHIQPSYYLNVLWRLESPVISLLAIVSLFFIIRSVLSREKKSQSVFLVSALFILPYVYWVAQRRLHQVEYNCLGAWPFLFLYIALGVDALFKNIRLKFFRITAMLFFLIIAVSYSLYHLRTLFEIKSHFPEISKILKEQKVTKLVIYKTGGIYAYKNIDPYLMTVEMYPADTMQEVYEIAQKEKVGFCFYGSWEYFLAKTNNAVVDGELVAKIRDTTMRPHYPLFFMGLMNSGIVNTQEAEAFKDKIYDYMYLYKIKLTNKS